MGTPLWRRYLRFWGNDPAADVDDEFAFHLEMRIEQLVQEGLTPGEARDEALRGFGDIHQVKGICTMLAEDHEKRLGRVRWWSDWQFDLRFALRQLMGRPLTTAVLLLTVALGVGATVAIFSVLNAVILRPLPFRGGDRIVFVHETWRQFTNANASVGHFHDWAEQNTVFEHVAAQQGATYNLADGEPERVRGATVTPGYFRVVHAPPTLGRYFTERDLETGRRVAVLSHGLWTRRFADRAIVGRDVRLNGEAHTIVGIAPLAYTFNRFSPEVWTPLVFTAEQRANYGAHMYGVMALLKPGVTRDAAQAEMARVTRGIAQSHPRQMVGRGVNVTRYTDFLLRAFRAPLFVLFAAVVFVLLIGCVNVANILLARATARRREVAIRAAIGGGRWRIIRQLLTESVVLSLIGGAAGVALAYAGIRLFVRFGPVTVPRLQEAGLQVEVLLFALAISALTGVIFGLAPAIHAGREDVAATLRDGGRNALPGRDWMRGTLVVSEIAITIVLLVGAGLFVRSAWRLNQVSLGFDVDRTVTARVALPEQRYSGDDAVTEAYRRIVEQLRAAPGVEKAGASTAIPMTGGPPTAGIMIQGRTMTPGNTPSPALLLVTDDYIEAVGMRLLRGRSLTAADMATGAPRTAIVNEQLAKVAWPGGNPIGQRISMFLETPIWYEVVGVVGDVHSAGPDTPEMPELFMPFTKPPFVAVRNMAFVARTSTPPGGHVASIRRAVAAVDPSLPLFDVMTMEEALARDVADVRFSAGLLSLLAITGLLLASIGIYGVVAYFVSQRTAEIGIRLALGASSRSVLLMVVRHTAGLAGAGIAVGVLLALASTRALATLLFEVPPTDPPTYVAGAAALFSIALLACAIPAVRALRVSPRESLADY